MVMAIGYEEAKNNKPSPKTGIYVSPNPTHTVKQTRFFGFRDNPDLPYAQLNCENPGRRSASHFHVVDQFQVIVDGKGTLGKHELAPYGVHFSRAYTPYGPLVSDEKEGFSFIVMRAHPDPGAQHLPKALDRLMQVPNRQPWQISRQVEFPQRRPDEDVVLRADSEIKDEHGLAAYTLQMKPNTRIQVPDPSKGDGQYVVVVKGSFLHEGKEHKSLALAFVKPNEGDFEICAGLAGLEAIVLNFPRPLTQALAPAKTAKAAASSKLWQCALCSFAYDEAKGMPEEGIAPGTRWEDVAETWSCPDCAASKADFQMVEVERTA